MRKTASFQGLNNLFSFKVEEFLEPLSEKLKLYLYVLHWKVEIKNSEVSYFYLWDVEEKKKKAANQGNA